MTPLPLASICVPLYNKGPYIAKTLEVLLQQTYSNLEVVVSDNGSTDDSTAIAQDFARRDPRVKYFRLHHTISMNESWRYCLRLAQGEFINVHSGDDHTLQFDFLEKMTEPLLRRSEIGFTVCEIHPIIGYTPPGFSGQPLVNCYRSIMAVCKELLNTSDRNERARKLLVRTVLENQIGSPYAAVCRRSCLPYSHWEKTRLNWPESYPDWDLMLRLFLDHRGEFVNGVHLSYHYEVDNPYWRVFLDQRAGLLDKMCRMMMPLTVLVDPALADIRRSALPEEITYFVQNLHQRIAELMETSDLVVGFDHPHFTRKVLAHINYYIQILRNNPADPGAVLGLRQLRNNLVRHWTTTPPEHIAREYVGSPGEAHRLLLQSGIQRVERAASEQKAFDDAARILAAKGNHPDAIGMVLALMLLTELRQMPTFHPGLIPVWLRADFDRLA